MFIWHCSKVLRSEIQMRIQDTPLQSNISKDSWCYPCNPLPSCCPRSSSRPNIEHSWQTGPVNVALTLSTSPICGPTKITYFNFARVILGNFSTIYSKPLEFLLPIVLMNCFISPRFMSKGGNKTIPGSTSGIILTVHNPSWYDVFGVQFYSTCLSVARLSQRHKKHQYSVKPECITINIPMTFKSHIFSWNISHSQWHETKNSYSHTIPEADLGLLQPPRWRALW